MDWKMIPQGYPVWAVFRERSLDWACGLVIGWFGDWPDSLRPIINYDGEMIRPEGEFELMLSLKDAQAAVAGRV